MQPVENLILSDKKKKQLSKFNTTLQRLKDIPEDRVV